MLHFLSQKKQGKHFGAALGLVSILVQSSILSTFFCISEVFLSHVLDVLLTGPFVIVSANIHLLSPHRCIQFNEFLQKLAVSNMHYYTLLFLFYNPKFVLCHPEVLFLAIMLSVLLSA